MRGSSATLPELTVVAIEGVGPSQVCLVWSQDDPEALITEFAELAGPVYAEPDAEEASQVTK
ncbi:hypothetical protein [Streptomyces sp. NBC_00996]|uniref:hypothetical protein n=1 Tax=Streptomyces sp. NBC_00996 TaxID=2903710 RepID=UPI0038667BB5|nr:hypothetical protein OG390_40960 [Streptomyces sp. NBC_00996]